MATKKNQEKFFFTKNEKKNNNYLENIRSKFGKRKKGQQIFINRKTIKYKGYNHTINNQNNFQKNNQTIMTILNSEDVAIKKSEEIFSQIAEGYKWIETDFGLKKNNS